MIVRNELSIIIGNDAFPWNIVGRCVFQQEERPPRTLVVLSTPSRGVYNMDRLWLPLDQVVEAQRYEAVVSHLRRNKCPARRVRLLLMNPTGTHALFMVQQYVDQSTVVHRLPVSSRRRTLETDDVTLPVSITPADLLRPLLDALNVSASARTSIFPPFLVDWTAPPQHMWEIPLEEPGDVVYVGVMRYELSRWSSSSSSFSAAQWVSLDDAFLGVTDDHVVRTACRHLTKNIQYVVPFRTHLVAFDADMCFVHAMPGPIHRDRNRHFPELKYSSHPSSITHEKLAPWATLLNMTPMALSHILNSGDRVTTINVSPHDRILVLRLKPHEVKYDSYDWENRHGPDETPNAYGVCRHNLVAIDSADKALDDESHVLLQHLMHTNNTVRSMHMTARRNARTRNRRNELQSQPMDLVDLNDDDDDYNTSPTMNLSQ